MPKPQTPSEFREPTIDELLALMHRNEKLFWKSGDGSPKHREEFLEALKARWRAGQKPFTPSLNPLEQIAIPEIPPDASVARRTGGQYEPCLAQEVSQEVSESETQMFKTVLLQEGLWEKASAAITRIPVWKDLGPWLKWASACFAFAATMTQVGEFLWAEVGLILCGFCCLMQVFVWTVSARPWTRIALKLALGFASIALAAVSMLTVVKIKGDKKWTNLASDNKNAVTPNSSPSSATNVTPNEAQIIAAPSIQPIKPSPSSSASPSPPSTTNPSVGQSATIPFGFVAVPVSAQLIVEPGQGQSVLKLLRTQAAYQGPESVLQFELLNLGNESVYFGGANVDHKHGVLLFDSRYWQTVDTADLYLIAAKTCRVGVTFVWPKPMQLEK